MESPKQPASSLRYAKANEWNKLPDPDLTTADCVSAAKIIANQSVWMPKAFVDFIKDLNEVEQEELIALHPKAQIERARLERYFERNLAIGFPFARRIISGEKAGHDWLHRYKDEEGEILDDNRLPKMLWSFAYCGYPLRMTETGAWKSHGFCKYEVTHILPHKEQPGGNSVMSSVFKNTNGFDANLLFLSSWNILLVNKQVAGLTDNSPIITALLLLEAKRRYELDLGVIGELQDHVFAIDIKSLHSEISWPPSDPPSFAKLYADQNRFSQHRKSSLKKIFTTRPYRKKQTPEPRSKNVRGG